MSQSKRVKKKLVRLRKDTCFSSRYSDYTLVISAFQLSSVRELGKAVCWLTYGR